MHHLTAYVPDVTIRWRTRQPMSNSLALLAHWSVRQQLNHVSSAQFSYVALYAPKYIDNWRVFTSMPPTALILPRSATRNGLPHIGPSGNSFIRLAMKHAKHGRHMNAQQPTTFSHISCTRIAKLKKNESTWKNRIQATLKVKINVAYSS